MTDTSAPAEAAGYAITFDPPDDSDISWVDRNRLSRLAIVSAVALVTAAGPAIFGALIGSIFGPIGALIVGVAGFGVGGFLLARLSHRLFVYNEEWQAYLTQDPFSGQNIPYGPGLHLSHVWEERNKNGNYSLTVVTKQFEVAVQSKTAKVTVTGQFQYSIDLSNIKRFIGISASTVEDGLTAFIESFLTRELARDDAEHARQNTDDINKKLKKEFMGEDDAIIDFEQKYGIITVNLILKTIKLPEEAQKTRDSVDEAKTLMQIVAELSGMSVADYQTKRTSGEISADQHKQLLDRAMAVSGNNAKINVNTIESSGGNNAVTPMLPVGS